MIYLWLYIAGCAANLVMVGFLARVTNYKADIRDGLVMLIWPVDMLIAIGIFIGHIVDERAK